MLGLTSAETGQPEHNKQTETKATRSRNATAKPPNSVRKPGRRGGPHFEIHPSPEVGIIQLSPSEKRKLATEVFNNSLKHLTGAVKSGRTNLASQSARSSPKRPLQPQRPLQECSPNRGKAPSRKTPTQPSPCEWEATANCACAAIDYLWGLNVKPESAQEEETPGLENAALLLVDKLVTLKLTEQAEQQLDRIYEQFCKRRRPKQPTQTPAVGDYSRHLIGPSEIPNKRVFGFTTSLQSQALRLSILLGPKCVSQDLTEAIRLDRVGSPAWMVTHGLQNGYLSPEAAGTQLRTISQAISKLHSLCVHDISQRVPPSVSFDLFMTGLHVKAASWRQLGCEPDVEREVLRSAGRAVKRLCQDVNDDNKATLIVASERVQSLTALLTSLRSSIVYPPELSDGLMQLAKKVTAPEPVLSLLEAQLAGPGTRSNVQLLIENCKITTVRLTAFSTNIEAALRSSQNTINAFDGDLKLSVSQLGEFLIHGAQMRKAAADVVSAVDRVIENGKSSGIHTQMQTCALKLIFAFLNFLWSHARSTLPAQSVPMCSEPPDNQQRALRTTIVKTIDAVLASGKCYSIRTLVASEEANDALCKCQIFAEYLLTTPPCLYKKDTLYEYLGGLHVRISHLFWVLYLSAVEARLPAKDQLRFLHSSVNAVAGKPFEDQKAALLGLKYEKLGVGYLDLNEFRQASDMLQHAIEFRIKEGTLTDTVELALRGPLQQAWNGSNQKCQMLGADLDMYARLCSRHLPQSDHHPPLFDCQALPAVHRALTLERQICAMADQDLTDRQNELLLSSSRLVFELLAPAEYRICRLRFASSLLATTCRKGTSIENELLPGELLQSLLDTGGTSDRPAFLQTYASGLRVLLKLQWNFSNGRVDNLQHDVKELSGIIQPCKTLADLNERFDNINVCVALLQTSADYANVSGDEPPRLEALESIRHILALGYRSSQTTLLTCLTNIGSLQNRLQNTIAAGRAFAQAENVLQQDGVDPSAEVEWALSYAEYLLNLSNFTKCSDLIDRAGTVWKERCSTGPGPRKWQLREKMLLCKAAHLTSRWAFHQGRLAEATVYGRQSVKLSTAIWLMIEKPYATAPSSLTNHGDGSHEQALTADFSNLSLCSNRSSSTATPKGAMFWNQVSLHCSTLCNMAEISAHHGLCQDAAHYYEQALKVACQTANSTFGLLIQSGLALLHASAGQSLQAEKVLSEVPEKPEESRPSLQLSITSLNLAAAYGLLGNHTVGRKLTSHAREYLSQTEGSIVEIDPPLVERETRTRLNRTPGRHRGAKPQPRPPKGNAADKLASGRTLTVLHTTLDQQCAVDRLVTLEYSMKLWDMNKNTHHSGDDGRDPFAGYYSGNPQTAVAKALLMLHEAFQLFSHDAVNGVLAETAMALPVRYVSARKSGRMSFVRGALEKRTAEVEVSGRGRKGPSNPTVPSPNQGQALLQHVYRLLGEVEKSQASQSSSDVVHVVHRIMTQIALMSTGLTNPFVDSSFQLLLELRIAKDQVRQRERISIFSEQATAEREQVERWPDVANDVCMPNLPSPTAADVLGLLPPSWTIVSIDLSQDQTEFLVAKISATRSPFVMRIPLTRPDLAEDENNELDFAATKAELLDIIHGANTTAHDLRGRSADKSTRKVWFAEREALDSRFQALLANMENIWLGGFRGLLSGRQVDDLVLSRFEHCLSQTLDKHLPSRQRSARSLRPKVVLHAHVLELFVTLGHPEEAELEDAITDLLYFVVDVLQFNGEPNAYDEIDFDAMLVDVLDALRSCHEAREEHARPQEREHIILVLDKQLQAFPWESLPCLEGRSVSRMPSLGAIKERLSVIRAQREDAEGYSIPAASGAYMLNPSSDLTSTQDTFAETFRTQLPQFSAIVNRVPSETEFEACLHDHALFLYFGHGSGAQYIRGRTIRKMDTCAVSLLMGCSSAKMTECGVYEPYGMPWHYINAGSPAVVGTLWDVTDRDIDRFAMKMMAEWGLIWEESNTQATAGKSNARKAKDGKASPRRTRGVVALDQAVAQARDSCMLRYLNGAAPVIYGVPVFLE